MKIITKVKNLKFTPDIESFLEKKFLPLKKFSDALAEVFVELQKETKHHKQGDVFLASAEIRLPARNLIASARADSLEKAIDEVKDEMKLEIEKYKFKKIDIIRRPQMKKEEDI